MDKEINELTDDQAQVTSIDHYDGMDPAENSDSIEVKNEPLPEYSEEGAFPDFDDFIKENAAESSSEESETKHGFFKELSSSPIINTVIRILLGLVCLVFGQMGFVPDWVKAVLSIAAVVACGYPIVLNVIRDIASKRFLSEYIIILFSALIASLVGYVVDAVLLLILADVGFTFRDNLMQWFSDEARVSMDGEGCDKDENVLEGRVKLITALFTPVIAALAIFVAVLALLFGGEFTSSWIHRALTVLVVGCPVASLTVAVLIYDFGKGSAAKNGIYFSDAKSINSAAGLTSVIFNKTGTVTDGTYMISGVYPVRISENQLLYLAAYAEAFSEHPIAKAIKAYAGVSIDKSRIERHREDPGSGNVAQLSGGNIVCAGNLELMEKLGVKGEMEPVSISSVYIAVNKTYVGRIDFEDRIKSGTREAVSKLRREGISSVAMITGDNTLSATRLGREVGITEIYADCLPKDKYDRVQYIAANQEPDDKLGFITAAESDISAATLADLRIILGEAETIPSSVLIPSARTELIPEAIKCAKTVAGRTKAALIILFSIKVISMFLALLGVFGMFSVAFLDTAVLLITALWAMFSFGEKKKKQKKMKNLKKQSN